MSPTRRATYIRSVSLSMKVPTVAWDAVRPDARIRTRSRLETCQTMLVEYGNQGGDG